jgi:CMP-N,N'-diacetyllegionaminic acid synthase
MRLSPNHACKIPSNTVAIIPARKNSERLPRKNLQLICGQPMVAWTIRAALESKWVDDVFVATDCEETAKIAEGQGADAIMLPPHITEPDMHSTCAVLHAIETGGLKQRITCMLLPTSPLRQSHHIDEALELLVKNGLSCNISVISVVKTEIPLNRLSYISPNRRILRAAFPMKAKDVTTVSQQSPYAYVNNGAIYAACTQAFLATRHFRFKTVRPYIMDEKSGIDIDTPQDLSKAMLFASYEYDSMGRN